MKRSMRLFLLDDHALFREGFHRLLASDPSWQMVGQCGDVDEALQQLKGTAGDVLILDYDPGARTAVQTIERRRVIRLEGQVLLVTAGFFDGDALQLMRL